MNDNSFEAMHDFCKRSYNSKIRNSIDDALIAYVQIVVHDTRVAIGADRCPSHIKFSKEDFKKHFLISTGWDAKKLLAYLRMLGWSAEVPLYPLNNESVVAAMPTGSWRATRYADNQWHPPIVDVDEKMWKKINTEVRQAFKDNNYYTDKISGQHLANILLRLVGA